MIIAPSISSNTRLKILSIVAAVIVWLFISFQHETEMTLKVPLEIMNIPQGVAISNTPLPEVVVTLKGWRYGMMISNRDVKVLLDLNGTKEGPVTYPALEEQVRLPEGVRVTRIFPSKLTLELRRTRQ